MGIVALGELRIDVGVVGLITEVERLGVPQHAHVGLLLGTGLLVPEKLERRRR